MLKFVPPLCEEHAEKLGSIASSDADKRDRLVGGFIVGTEDCAKCNPPGDAAAFSRLSDPNHVATGHRKGDCAACLAQDWLQAFSREWSRVRNSFDGSIEGYLHARARLKANFPGYPGESTPRKDCFSTEEYLLREGKLFVVRPLDEKERSVVGRVHQELKRLGGGQVPSGQSRFSLSGAWETVYNVDTGELVDVPRTPEDHLDPWTDFAVAQLAWDLTDGGLSYVEGFTFPQEGSGAVPIATAWNLINGKVADARQEAEGRRDSRFFGAILDAGLRKTPPGNRKALPRILPFVVPAHLFP